MDSAPRREVVDHIRRIAEATPGVERVEKCMARKSGYHFYVDMHVEVDPGMTVQRSHDIAHEVKNRVCGELPGCGMCWFTSSRRGAKRGRMARRVEAEMAQGTRCESTRVVRAAWSDAAARV